MPAKFKLIRHSTTQVRVWEDEHGGIFLADQSGDKPGHIGTPDETKDGPLLVDPLAKRITLELDKSTGRWAIPVMVLRRSGLQDPMAVVKVSWETALFLSDKMKVPIELKLRHRVFALVEVNVAARESVLI